MFLTKTDLTTMMYAEDIEAITEGDDTKVDSCIASAVAEAQGYCDRYDIGVLFGRAGSQRDPILAESCKALACWYLIALCPPNQDTKDVKDRATDARTWLGKVQAGKVKPVNWPYIIPEEKNTFFHVTSYDKRENNY